MEKIKLSERLRKIASGGFGSQHTLMLASEFAGLPIAVHMDFLNHHEDREELYQCIKAYGLKKDISEVTYADIAVMIEELGKEKTTFPDARRIMKLKLISSFCTELSVMDELMSKHGAKNNCPTDNPYMKICWDFMKCSILEYMEAAELIGLSKVSIRRMKAQVEKKGYTTAFTIRSLIEEVGGWDIPDRLKDLDVSYKYLDDNNKSSQNREKYNHSLYKNIEADFLPIEIWLVAPIARIAAIKLGEKANRKEKECPELAAQKE